MIKINKLGKLASFSAVLFVLTPCITSCGNSNDTVLRIYNWEDYIYLNSPDDGYDEPDFIDQFETWYEETYHKNITVIYDTFDTNESMLSQIQTGKVSYDLICPSDYTIQRMIQEDLLIPFDDNATPYYDMYASSYLLGKLDKIKITKYDENGDAYIDESLNVNDYARGYMWGTLGILYNPENGVVDPDEMREDLASWNCLWDSKYKNKVSIKDSLRDTYAAGILRAFDKEFTDLKNNKESLGLEAYNDEVTELFNRSDDEAVNKVLDALLELKENIFGFEVDSGKQDIQTGKIWLNLAWSGDATYAMDQAEENDDPIYLEYSIPDTGANIWFDGWVMPKGANKELAQIFVDYISNPINAVKNVDYTGYSSFIEGQEIFDLIASWYDPRINEDEEFDPSIEAEDDWIKKDLSYFFESVENPILYVEPDQKNRQLDTLYPNEDQLDYLAVMDDFPIDRRAQMLNMWEELKSTPLPTYVYIILAVAVVLLVGLIVGVLIKNRIVRHNRITRRKLRQETKKKAAQQLNN